MLQLDLHNQPYQPSYNQHNQAWTYKTVNFHKIYYIFFPQTFNLLTNACLSALPSSLEWVSRLAAKHSESQAHSASRPSRACKNRPPLGQRQLRSIQWENKLLFHSSPKQRQRILCGSDCTESCLFRNGSDLMVLWQSRKKWAWKEFKVWPVLHRAKSRHTSGVLLWT